LLAGSQHCEEKGEEMTMVTQLKKLLVGSQHCVEKGEEMTMVTQLKKSILQIT
jgi:hypothetical protein